MKCNTTIIGSMRRAMRPASLIRALWIAVAALHAWLIVARVINGEWAGLMDLIRAALCLVAIGYASLKFWDIATIFDRGPRRALTFTLILILGHFLVASPHGNLQSFQQPIATTAASILVILPVLSAALILAVVFRSRSFGPRIARSTASIRPVAPVAYELAHLPIALTRRTPTLFRRPPPTHIH